MTGEVFGALAVFSIPGVLFAVRWLPPPRRRPAGLHRRPAGRGVVVTEFRDCPVEGKTRAVIVRSDGTGRCDCGATIPAFPLTTLDNEGGALMPEQLPHDPYITAVTEDDQDEACPVGMCGDYEDCGACDGSGDDMESGSDEGCWHCDGTGRREVDHCCQCGGSPYCNCCPKCSAANIGGCACPVTVTLQDGGVQILPPADPAVMVAAEARAAVTAWTAEGSEQP